MKDQGGVPLLHPGRLINVWRTVIIRFLVDEKIDTVIAVLAEPTSKPETLQLISSG